MTELLTKRLSKYRRNVACSVNQEQNQNATLIRSVEDNEVSDVEATDVLADVRTQVTHLRLPSVLIALLIDTIQETERRLQATTLLSNSADIT